MIYSFGWRKLPLRKSRGKTRMVNMRRFAMVAAFLIGSALASVSFAKPQQASATPSLGDYARKLKAERAKEGEKPPKLFTNDNIPRAGSLSEVGSTPQSAASATAQGEGKAAGGAHDEKYYRETMKELQSQKAIHQRELAVLEQKLNLNETQYYADPNKTLLQEFTRSDISKKQADIEKKKQQIADDDKAISDLEAQCQREGCPPGWLR